MKLVLRPSFDRFVRRVGIVLSAFGLAFAAASARAEVVTEDLVNPDNPEDIWGQKITGLGAGDEVALIFTKTGETMSWTLPDGVKYYSFLVVGGGGGGGGFTAGGGGGGGGVVTGIVNSVEKDVALSVTVGDGGAGGASNGAKGANGSDSQIAVSGNPLVVAYGGGGGAGKGFNSGTVGSGGGGNGGTTLTGKSASKGYFDETMVTAFTFGNKGGNSKKDSPTACAWSGAGGGGATEAGVDVTAEGLPSDGKGGGTKGGEGLTCDITGIPRVYGSGGGGGASNTYGHRGYGGTNAGNGVQAKNTSSPRDGVPNFGGGGGGGGANDSVAKGGKGGSGIVVIRYRVMAANEVVVPKIEGTTYNGELQTADISDGEGYTVTKNDGGTNAGDYEVVLTLESGYQWEGGSTDPTNLTFTIAKAANGWTTEPSLSKTTWELSDDPATVNAGAALSETAVLVTYDEGEDVMPLTVGLHKVVFTVEESQNYLGLSKTINYTINKNTNSWTVEPSMTKTTWTVVGDPGVIDAGEAKYGEIVVTYDNDPELTELPTSVGTHTVKFTVAEADTYKGLDKAITYTVTKVTNAWLTEPRLTKTTWAFDEEPGEVVDGEAKYGDVDVIYDDDRSLVDLPTDLGEHTVKFAVDETDTYTGLEKVVNYTVTKKQHNWIVPPNPPATVNIEDGVNFPMPVAEPGVEVKAYFDGDPEKTELMEIAVGETHTVTYAIEGDDDWDEVKQTFTFKGVYKSIVDPVDPSKVYGYRIPKLGANQDEVALVFTNTSYTADNPITWKLPQEVTEVSYLVVGGGGAGATSNSGHGSGGGGAGGVVSNDEMLVVTAGGALAVYVGAGGRAYAVGAAKNGGDGANSGLVADGHSIVAKKGAGGVQQGAGKGGDAYACGSGAGNSANGASGRTFAGGEGEISNGAGVTTIGANGGGGGGAGASATGAIGGAGVAVTIFSDGEYFIAGGGSGTASNWSTTDGSVGGGGYANRWGTYGTHIDAGAGTRWGAGGGGGGNNAAGGAGHQGVVVVRYVNPQGVVMVPTILPKTYTGETLVADVPVNVGYAVTENEGGTDVDDYDVVLTLNVGYHWDGGSTEPTNLTFKITPAQNEWTVEPSITKTTWLTTDDPGELTAGETKFGTPTATISKDGGDAESFDGTLPTAAGQYVITYKVETSDNWIDPEVTEKSVSFEIVSGDVVPPFTVTKGEMTTVVGEGQVDLSVGYAVHCDVESDKTVDIYAYIAEDGADVTNEVKIAEDVALDAVGTGIVPDLKPGVTYWVALDGRGGDTVAPTTEFTAVTVAGPATGLTASATFTNNPKEFIITGSVTPGLGTTTVYVRWSLNSKDLDESAEFTFANGDAGAFTNKVQYVAPTDWLWWDVAVSNSYTSTTHGEQSWGASLPPSKRDRVDTAETIYRWTGAGEDNNWSNPENWSANRAESFGYPDNVNYAIAQITQTVTINLGGGTYSLVKGGSIWMDANSGDVVTFTNGTIKMAIGDKDTELGAAGTTLVFRDVKFDRKRMNPVEGATVVVEGASTFTGMIRPKAKAVKIIFRNSENITIGDIFNSNSPDGITGVTVSNALVTVENATVPSTTWTPATFPVTLQNGPDRQARLIFRNTQYDNYNKWDFVQSPYTLTIPERPYETPYLQTAKPAETTSYKPTFKIDVTNWKRGKRVPILKFTQSATGAAEQYGGATVKAYENGVDVTTKRNAHLEWDETTKTLYYKQDAQGGFALIVK